MKPSLALLVGALAFLLTTTSASAQLSTAQLSGRITDESGAVLPGVTVTATQTDTGLTRSVTTDAGGTYVLPNLPTGPYRLEAMLQGFRTYSQTGIVLQVAASPSVNVVLAIGNVAENVSVEAAAPIVDVQSAGISDVIDNERIVELPLQGRQVTDLIVLAGAAVQTGVVGTRNFPGGVTISVAGGLPIGVGYLLDGATHNSPQSNVNLPMPFPDALQEFRVQTSGLSAQNGMHAAASVNAVTKSGTNNLHGIGFEFLRDHRLNATSPFAVIKDGKRQDDGLKRNQFGGTIGGPIMRDKLFFFGGYQGTTLRFRPADQIAFVPTAAMKTGDFTAFASPACNNGRTINLGGGFVGNRIDPALFSPAAMRLAGRLPTATDPCGQITYSTTADSNEGQGIGRIDYQMTQDHTVFGRYMATFIKKPPAYQGGSDIVIKAADGGLDNLAHALTLGDTMVFGPSMVNAIRVAYNRTTVNRYNTPYFDPSDLGIKLYPYVRQQMAIQVPGAWEIPAGSTSAFFRNNFYQAADDLTLVRGSHQLGFGANVAYWNGHYNSSSRAAGIWIFDGSASGLALADMLLGRVTSVEHGAPQDVPVHSYYAGFYGQDTWRATDRVTFNLGLRWEPYFGVNVDNNAVYNFNIDNFRKGVKSKVFVNAPAGFLYPGDDGFPSGKTGLNKQWTNFSPRAGVAWDVNGNGRMAVRASYSLGYDFMSSDYHQINSSAPPFGNRSLITDPPGRMDDPYAAVGGDPHPIVTNRNTAYPAFGSFGTMNPDINSPRVQTWNVTFERQIGASWGVAASYIGTYSDRLWAQTAINPGLYMGLGPCTLRDGRTYTVCSTNANLNVRRALYQENPTEAALIGTLDLNDDIGWQEYRGLKLSVQRRSSSGLSLSGNYTLSRCMGTKTPNTFSQIASGYTNPNDPEFDRGYCDQDKRHLASVTLSAESPSLGGGALGMLASRWRASGIVTMQSGTSIDIISGRDNALNGQRNQRVNKVSDDVYAHPRTLTNYFNAAAFAQPDPGTFGNLMRQALRGPNYWNVDLAVTRQVGLVSTQNLELRLEAFNLFNTFNWGMPGTELTAGGWQANLNSGTFGRITTQAGAPRIIQLGVKYAF
ncbi:MAG TPA: TonB-dependent receptor [Vicinamibacterales bacterium]|nr:TonB-dependent receptor [Vicinamibacterales bacterium]